MKRFLYSLALCACILVLSVVVCSCSKQEDVVSMDRPVYDAEHLSEYVRLDAYTNLSVSLETSETSKGEAVWALILERAEVLSYPEDALAYYVEQERQACRHYAKQEDLSYEEALEHLNTSEERILEKAQEMVKADLVYEYIRTDAGIVLTDAEKESLFDRYADRFAEQYGYDLSKVKESMVDLVYESMLYDKTMEYLIVHNTFTVE